MGLGVEPRFRTKARKYLSAPVAVAAAATGTIVAAVPAVTGGPGTGLSGSPAQGIVVVGFLLTGSTTATTAQFKSSTGPTALTGPMYMPVDGSLFVPAGEIGLFETAPGDSLQLSAVTGIVNGWVVYFLDPGPGQN